MSSKFFLNPPGDLPSVHIWRINPGERMLQALLPQNFPPKNLPIWAILPLIWKGPLAKLVAAHPVVCTCWPHDTPGAGTQRQREIPWSIYWAYLALWLEICCKQNFMTHERLSRWWLNQPLWKICSSKWDSYPNGGEHEKYLKPPPSIFQFIISRKVPSLNFVQIPAFRIFCREYSRFLWWRQWDKHFLRGNHVRCGMYLEFWKSHTSIFHRCQRDLNEL